MADYTLPLPRVGPREVALVGGKGAGLGALIDAGFPVPAGFVVTTAAYRDFLDVTGLAGLPAAELRERIPREPVPERIAAAVLAAHAELGGPAVAVRSSGTAEDLADASFAGQHDTYLGVDGGQALLAAVRDCWASLWTPRAVAYRKRYGWDESGLALAVVVQEMVDAEWAGVLFTADPVSGRRDRVVIEAVRGLGEALVSGTVTGEHLVVDKATRRRVNGAGSVPGIGELVRVGCAVEEAFGGPQDIEWAYAVGRLHLLQARPLTALPEEPARTRSRRRPRNYAMAADHMPFPPFPMDTSLFIRPALRSVLAATRAAGLATPTLDETVVEIDDGVIQLVPPTGVRLTWRAVVGLPRAAPAVVRLLRTSTTEWRARSEATLVTLARRVDGADLGALSDRELFGHLDGLLGAAGALMPSRFGAVPRGMLAGVLAERLLGAVVGRRRAGPQHAELMSAIPCVTTAANAELERIAATVRTTPELCAAYRDEEPAQMAERLRGSAAGRALLADVDAYLRVYGFREMSIFTVGLPPLRETPEVAHGLIKGLAQGGSREGPDAAARAARARAELTGARGLRARLLVPAILRLVDAARASAGFREDSHYQLVMTLAVARRVVLELGRRLTERGLLETADDVAYLERSELLTLSPVAARRTVARRKAARRAALPQYTIIPAGLAARPAGGNAVQGTPASRGTAAGPVRVVHDESEFASLQEGEVLVCPYTNPTWTPLFSLAAAVVVDAGGAASHAAIVAREHGIPAVMGTGNGTRMLSDGQRVVVDGDAGTVVPLAGPLVGSAAG